MDHIELLVQLSTQVEDIFVSCSNWDVALHKKFPFHEDPDSQMTYSSWSQLIHQLPIPAHMLKLEQNQLKNIDGEIVTN